MLERKVKARIVRDLERFDHLTREQVVDIVWQGLGVRELAYERAFSAEEVEAAVRATATYDSFVSSAKHRMVTDIARAVVEHGVTEYTTESTLPEHPSAQRISARMLVITRLA